MCYCLIGSSLKFWISKKKIQLQWRHNGRYNVSNHQPHACLLNRLFRRRSKKTSKLRFTGLCAGNSPVPGEFPAQMANNAENVSIWWRHHDVVTVSANVLPPCVSILSPYMIMIMQIVVFKRKIWTIWMGSISRTPSHIKCKYIHVCLLVSAKTSKCTTS